MPVGMPLWSEPVTSHKLEQPLVRFSDYRGDFHWVIDTQYIPLQVHYSLLGTLVVLLMEDGHTPEQHQDRFAQVHGRGNELGFDVHVEVLLPHRDVRMGVGLLPRRLYDRLHVLAENGAKIAQLLS